MKISRVSPLTGKTNVMDLDIDPSTLQRWLQGEGFAQDMFPQLSADEREFLISGYTPENWATLFDDEDDEEGEPA